jgi:hypothetical protein
VLKVKLNRGDTKNAKIHEDNLLSIFGIHRPLTDQAEKLGEDIFLSKLWEVKKV